MIIIRFNMRGGRRGGGLKRLKPKGLTKEPYNILAPRRFCAQLQGMSLSLSLSLYILYIYIYISYIYIYTRMYMCVYVYCVRVYIHLSLSLYIYIYTHNYMYMRQGERSWNLVREPVSRRTLPFLPCQIGWAPAQISTWHNYNVFLTCMCSTYVILASCFNCFVFYISVSCLHFTNKSY